MLVPLIATGKSCHSLLLTDPFLTDPFGSGLRPSEALRSARGGPTVAPSTLIPNLRLRLRLRLGLRLGPEKLLEHFMQRYGLQGPPLSVPLPTPSSLRGWQDPA
jgi:hypothetical protein